VAGKRRCPGFGGGGRGEALQHRGADMEVRIGRNDEKSARRRCSSRKGSAATFPHDSGEVEGFFGNGHGQGAAHEGDRGVGALHSVQGHGATRGKGGGPVAGHTEEEGGLADGRTRSQRCQVGQRSVGDLRQGRQRH
jgi:hypothetical protein